MMMDVLITGMELSAIVCTNNLYNLHVCQLLKLVHRLFVMFCMFLVSIFCCCFFVVFMLCFFLEGGGCLLFFFWLFFSFLNLHKLHCSNRFRYRKSKPISTFLKILSKKSSHRNKKKIYFFVC